jgi:hypothetical protein
MKQLFLKIAEWRIVKWYASRNKKFYYWVAKKYCQYAGHDPFIRVEKHNNSNSIALVLFCGRCDQIFGQKIAGMFWFRHSQYESTVRLWLAQMVKIKLTGEQIKGLAETLIKFRFRVLNKNGKVVDLSKT